MLLPFPYSVPWRIVYTVRGPVPHASLPLWFHFFLSFLAHLSLFLFQVHDFCLPDCICHNEPGIWRANVVPMMTLGIVSVANFHGAPREVYFVKQVVLRAPSLKLLRIMSKVQDHSLDGIRGICPAGCVFEVVVVPG